VADVAEEVERAPPEAVELPDEHGVDITPLRGLENPDQAWSVVVRSPARLANVEGHVQPQATRGGGQLRAACGF
jgi:hypothetical protein